MKKKVLLILFLILTLGFPFGCQKKTQTNIEPAKQTNSIIPDNSDLVPAGADKEKAIKEALKIYEEQKKQGADFSEGPCLSNELIPDWTADIAHNPRNTADNLPANQCANFLTKKAHHFVELDPEGNLIRTM